MEKRLVLNATMMVDDYETGLRVGDLLTEFLENMGVLTEGVYAAHADYTVNGKDREELLPYL